jgi:hypothetical protein
MMENVLTAVANFRKGGILTSLKPEEVGIKIGTLWKKKVMVGSPYVGRKSTITAFEVVGKKQKNGK